MRNIKFKTLEKILLVVIILIGAGLYLYKLGTLPPGLYLDEAGTGYNTYSILKTGRDEYGKAFPLAFRLFGSYTPPLYIYLSVPLMAIFDLSIFSTRLLSAISGILAIPVLFLIIKELKITKSKFTPLIATAFFAITPWLVYFSRVGYEMNFAFLFFLISVLLVLKTLKNPKLVTLTIPFISLTTYTDYPQRFTVPLLFIGTAIIFWKTLKPKKNLKYVVIGIAAAILIQLPNLYQFTTPSFYTKVDHFYFNAIASQAPKIEHYLPTFLAVPLAFIREFSSQFFTYLSPRSLFFLGDDDPQRSWPGLSVFYAWMAIPFLAGLYVLGKNRSQPSMKFMIMLLLITPLAGALTKQPFQMQRTLALLLPITLVMTIGLDTFVGNRKVKLWLPIFIATLGVSLLMLWRSYFILLPHERATIWGFEFRQLAEYIRAHPDETFIIDQGVRTRPENMAYIQMAFYLKIPPQEIQADQDPAIAKNYYHYIKFSFVHKFANIETKSIDWGESVYRKNTVFVGDTAAISDDEAKRHDLTEVFEIKDPNDVIVLRGFKNNLK